MNASGLISDFDAKRQAMLRMFRLLSQANSRLAATEAAATAEAMRAIAECERAQA